MRHVGQDLIHDHPAPEEPGEEHVERHEWVRRHEDDVVTREGQDRERQLPQDAREPSQRAPLQPLEVEQLRAMAEPSEGRDVLLHPEIRLALAAERLVEQHPQRPGAPTHGAPPARCSPSSRTRRTSRPRTAPSRARSHATPPSTTLRS